MYILVEFEGGGDARACRGEYTGRACRGVGMLEPAEGCMYILIEPAGGWRCRSLQRGVCIYW